MDNSYIKKTSANTYIIRREVQEDYRETENLVREAFWNVYRPGCSEHYVLHTLFAAVQNLYRNLIWLWKKTVKSSDRSCMSGLLLRPMRAEVSLS